VPAVIAVLLHAGHVLLVRRDRPPNAGAWGFPGGKIERGERHEAAAARELREETGIVADSLGVFAAADVIDGEVTNTQPAPAYHYVLLAVRMRYRSGAVRAADDADAAAWFATDALPAPLLPDVARIVHTAERLNAAENA
jgi:ADP-ribose pyrophosphatase YjhB (NUDIX family)